MSTGSIASLTGIGTVEGIGAVIGGGFMATTGLGLIGVGVTQLEAETGVDLVPWIGEKQ